jgi:hypothetical protein
MTVFQQAMDRVIPGACKPGKQACKKSDRHKIGCSGGVSVSHSVDLDEAMKTIDSNEHRWDYGLALQHGQKEGIVWVEIHSACTSEVECVIAKKRWLTGWLITHANDIWQAMGFRLDGRNCYWIASGRYNIPRHTRQYRLLAKEQLIPSRGIVFTPKWFEK